MSRYSKIIAGCMSWGAWGRQFSTQEMISDRVLFASAISCFSILADWMLPAGAHLRETDWTVFFLREEVCILEEHFLVSGS